MYKIKLCWCWSVDILYTAYPQALHTAMSHDASYEPHVFFLSFHGSLM